MIEIAPDLIAAAREGSRDAVGALVLSIQRPVFNLAIRMLGHPADAEDATQEILVKVVTHLGEIRDPLAAGAWVFRIAMRHLVHVRKQGAMEAKRLTFRGFATDLETGLEELPDTAAKDVETQAMIEEVKIGCTLALLTCLSRPLRAAYVLGEIMELSDREAAAALEIDAAAFRQRLRRARALVTSFVQAKCGVLSGKASCRCDRRIMQAIRLGRVAPGRRLMPSAETTAPTVAEVRAKVAELERGQAAAALMRSNPDFTTNVGQLVIDAIGA